MKQLLVLSGKGGTGKTTVAGAFIELSRARAFADCDVDAPNLHLIVPLEAPHRVSPHYGMPKAHISTDRCADCGRCLQECRFGAISYTGEHYTVDPLVCEGCGLCEAVCPVGAVDSRPAQTGLVALADDGERIFSTAVLSMGSGNSGKLVWAVKKLLEESAHPGTELAIIDGSPGIGCPVMSSMGGVDLVLIVTEPSVSGRSDLKRLLDVAIGMGVPTVVCVNKADVNPRVAQSIEKLCDEWGIDVVGSIPFDPAASSAINSGRTLARDPGPAGIALRAAFENTMSRLVDRPAVV